MLNIYFIIEYKSCLYNRMYNYHTDNLFTTYLYPTTDILNFLEVFFCEKNVNTCICHFFLYVIIYCVYVK